MKKQLLTMCLLFAVPYLSFSQPAAPDCSQLKEGIFYSYPKYSLDRYVITRTGDLQQEIDVTGGDTSIWKLNWVAPCSYTLQFISGAKYEASLQALYKKHKIFVHIYGSNNNYYVYKAYRDSQSGVETDADTIWIKDNLAARKTYVKKDLVEASFPGGSKAWTNYITEVITDHIKSLSKANKTGTCYISFIVDKDGTVSNVEALSMENTELAKVSSEAIKNGPRWKPASINGKTVKAYRIQPVTFTF
jgi:Gram-negative bacterial TonB protein C-terminal